MPCPVSATDDFDVRIYPLHANLNFATRGSENHHWSRPGASLHEGLFRLDWMGL